MGRKSIPNSTRASSPTSTRFSKRSRRSFDDLVCGPAAWGFPLWLPSEAFGFQHPTSNIQLPRPNETSRSAFDFSIRSLDVGCWMLSVGWLPFDSLSSRRVMGAWWPSRSSKPLSARSTGRGMFDSYPLRHFHLRPERFEIPCFRPYALDRPIGKSRRHGHVGKTPLGHCRAGRACTLYQPQSRNTLVAIRKDPSLASSSCATSNSASSQNAPN